LLFIHYSTPSLLLLLPPHEIRENGLISISRLGDFGKMS
jgi:hypothetical protein